MPTIRFQISPAPSITNDLIAVIYNTLDPGAELDRILDDSDHSSPQNFQFANLDPGTYIIKIHESPDGSTLGNLRHDWWQDAVTNQILFERLFYVVDGPGPNDPVSGTNKIIDPYFEGKNITGLFQVGNRYLKPLVEWFVNASNELEFLSDLVGGQAITNNEWQVWTVEITYSQVASGSANQVFDDTVVITTNTTFGSSHYNKSIYARASATKLIFTVPALASIPENKGFFLIHDGGNAINVVLQLQPGEIARFRGGDYNDVKLGIGEVVKCVKKTISGTSYLFTKPIYGQWDRVGETIPVREIGPNMAIADGVTEYDLNVYVRLADYIDSLPSEQVVDYATQATKTGLFGKDNINNKAKLPNLLNSSVRFLKNIGGSDSERTDNFPGGFQSDGVGIVTATIEGKQAAVAGGNGGVPNIVPLKSTMVPPFTGGDENVPNLTFNGGSSDTRGKNHGFIPAILI